MYDQSLSLCSIRSHSKIAAAAAAASSAAVPSMGSNGSSLPDAAALVSSTLRQNSLTESHSSDLCSAMSLSGGTAGREEHDYSHWQVGGDCSGSRNTPLDRRAAKSPSRAVPSHLRNQKEEGEVEEEEEEEEGELRACSEMRMRSRERESLEECTSLASSSSSSSSSAFSLMGDEDSVRYVDEVRVNERSSKV